jgi:hypothetical protein
MSGDLSLHPEASEPLVLEKTIGKYSHQEPSRSVLGVGIWKAEGLHGSDVPEWQREVFVDLFTLDQSIRPGPPENAVGPE